MKKKIILAAIEATKTYWVSTEEWNGKIESMMLHIAEGKLAMACAAIGGKAVKSALQDAGLSVPPCVEVAAKNL